MSADYIVRFSPQYSEGHVAHAERLAVEVSKITALAEPETEDIRVLAYLVMKGPSEMSTLYWHSENPPHATGERQIDGMIKKFLVSLSYEEREMFRKYAEEYGPKKFDRIQYLLGEH